GDFLVQPLRRRRLVPDSPVLIACKRPCERGVRRPALLARCRLIDSRPDQRVPEPEFALVERSESGRNSRRPAVAVDVPSEELFGRSTPPPDLAVLHPPHH